MPKLKIGSFNIRNCNSKKEKLSNAKELIELIKNEKINILGTQELTKIYEKELQKGLPEYKFFGNYRFGKWFLKNNKYNENNIIITDKTVINHRTIWLPWIAKNYKDLKESIVKKSIMPRIATMITIYDKEFGKLKMINTHLDHKIPTIKKIQLEKLEKMIMKIQKKEPVILTGDFNLQEQDEMFKEFMKALEKNNMKKVVIEGNTWTGKNGSGKKIDHIFIPSSWKIINKGLLDSRGISDHNPIYVEVEIPIKNKFNKFINKIKEKLKIN